MQIKRASSQPQHLKDCAITIETFFIKHSKVLSNDAVQDEPLQ